MYIIFSYKSISYFSQFDDASWYMGCFRVYVWHICDYCDKYINNKKQTKNI